MLSSGETTTIRNEELSLARDGDMSSTRVEVSTFLESMPVDQSLATSVEITQEDRRWVPVSTFAMEASHDPEFNRPSMD